LKNNELDLDSFIKVYNGLNNPEPEVKKKVAKKKAVNKEVKKTETKKKAVKAKK